MDVHVFPSRSPLSPPSPPHPSGSSQGTSPEHLSHASSLGWWSVSPLIVYLFQCCFLRTSHPCLLPQSLNTFYRWGQLGTWMQVKEQQLEPDMEQWTCSKLGEEYIKAVYCHPAYLTYMQSTSRKMPGWMKHKLESGLAGEISITSDMLMTTPLCQKAKSNQRASWRRRKRRVKRLA